MFNEYLWSDTFFPFLPENDFKTFNYKDYKGARIIIEVPAYDIIDTSMPVIASLLAIKKNSNDNIFYADIRVTVPQYNYNATIEVKIIRKSDNVYINNYLISDNPIEISGLNIKINPKCILILQKAPYLYLKTRTNIKIDGSYTEAVNLIAGSTIYISNGYNVEVLQQYDANNYTLIFNGVSDAGLGVYPSTPIIDAPVSITNRSEGLKSINGISNNVNITGSSSIVISTSTSENSLNIKIEKAAD